MELTWYARTNDIFVPMGRGRTYSHIDFASVFYYCHDYHHHHHHCYCYCYCYYYYYYCYCYD